MQHCLEVQISSFLTLFSNEQGCEKSYTILKPIAYITQQSLPRNSVKETPYKPSQAPIFFCNTLCNHCRCFPGSPRPQVQAQVFLGSPRPQTGTVWHTSSYARWALQSFSEWTTSAPKVRIAIYEVLHVYDSRFKPNTYLSICDCKLTVALLKLSRHLCMQLIHEAGCGVPQQVITTAQAARKQVKQIQAGFEQELFARLPIYRLALIHKQPPMWVSLPRGLHCESTYGLQPQVSMAVPTATSIWQSHQVLCPEALVLSNTRAGATFGPSFPAGSPGSANHRCTRLGGLLQKSPPQVSSKQGGEEKVQSEHRCSG